MPVRSRFVLGGTPRPPTDQAGKSGSNFKSKRVCEQSPHLVIAVAMLSDSYQGGASIELFSPHGRDPMAACKVTNGAAGVRKEFDKHVRGFVVVCDGGPKTKLQFPIDEKKGRTFAS